VPPVFFAPPVLAPPDPALPPVPPVDGSSSPQPTKVAEALNARTARRLVNLFISRAPPKNSD
jgi:hypothetical protein